MVQASVSGPSLHFLIDDNQGRTFFMINQAGINGDMSKPASTASDGAINVGGCATPAGAPRPVPLRRQHDRASRPRQTTRMYPLS